MAGRRRKCILHHLLKGGAASIPLQLKAQRSDAKSGGISKRRRNEATWKHHNERDRPGRQGSLRLPASKGHRQAAVTASHVVARRYWWRGLKEQKLVHLLKGGAASKPLQLKAQRSDAKSGGISKRRRNEATWKHHNERDRPGRQGSLRLPASKGHRQAAVTASHVVARRYWWRGLWWCWRGVTGKS